MRTPELPPTGVTEIGLIMKYGKVLLSFGETAHVLNRGMDGLSAYLHEHGVTVKRIGNRKGAKKLVHVSDIVKLAADKSENVAAIRND